MMKVSQLLKDAVSQLSAHSDTARLDAEILFTFALSWRRTQLITQDDQLLNDHQVDKILQLIRRRIQGEPIAYIVGEQEFWSLPLHVDSNTLIPRPETELLVESALDVLLTEKAQNVLDLGTGSGAVALALASERKLHRFIAVDISADALAVAKNNSKKLGIESVEFRCGNWFAALNNLERFDLIVSNPPYIKSDDPHLAQGDVAFEPRTALASGEDGLLDIRSIAENAKDYLNAASWIMFEHGWNQSADVRNILAVNGYDNIQSLKDLSGHERVTKAQKK